MYFLLTYCENEAVSAPENITKELGPPPHHIKKLVRIIEHLSGEVDASYDKLVAVEVLGKAMVEGSLVHRNKEEMIDQKASVMAFSKALKEELQHAVLFDVCLVEHCDDEGLVGHG